MFPVYSLVRENLARFRRVYLQTLQRVALVALPVSVAMFAAAGPIVHALLGPGWEETITPLRVLAVYGLVKSFAAPSGEVFKGAGRPELGLYLGALQIALVLPLLIVLVRSFGLNGAAVAMMSAMALCGAIRVWLTLRLVGGTGRELARALAPSALCSVLLGFSLALPALVVFGSLPGGLLSALIIGIGMRQAWQMTGVPPMQISGPYRIAAASPPAL